MQTVCRRCHFGRIQATLAPFMASHAGKLLLVPNAPAYSCDFCGSTEHDATYLQSLQMLLREQSLPPAQASNQQSPLQKSLLTPIIKEYPLG